MADLFWSEATWPMLLNRLRMPMKLPGQSALFSPRFRRACRRPGFDASLANHFGHWVDGTVNPWMLGASAWVALPIFRLSVDQDLAADDSGSSPRAFFEYFEAIVLGSRIKGLKAPSVEDQQLSSPAFARMRRWQPSRVGWSPPRRSDELLYGRGGITGFTSRDNRGLTRARRLIARSLTGSIPQKPARGLK